MEEKGKKVSNKNESKKNESVEKKAKSSTSKSVVNKTKKSKETKPKTTNTKETKTQVSKAKQTGGAKVQKSKTKQDEKETPKATAIKQEKVIQPKATKVNSIKEEKVQATKVKQVKIDTKPINSGYTRVTTTKQAEKGKSGIVLLVVMLIVLSIYFISTCRNYLILTQLNNRYNQYVEIDNYHKTAVNEGDDIEITRIDVYKKGAVAKNIIQAIDKKIIQISSPTGGTKMFFDTPSGKVMTFQNSNASFFLALNDINYVSTNRLIRSLGMPITSEKVDGVDCYVLSAKNSKAILYKGENTKEFQVYIEKETGLLKQLIEKYVVKGEVKTRIIKYTREYNNVKDSDLSAPSDIGEYVIQNNK